MKKFILMLAGLSMASAASADWGTDISNPVTIFPTGTSSYATVVKATPDGGAWALIYHPNLRNAEDEMDIDHVVYEYRLQRFDKNGNAVFDNDGILISDYNNISYTVVNEYLLADSEGNAVLAVADCRNSEGHSRSYTAYKVAPDGTMLWDEDGVAISDPLTPADFAACMQMVELEDHSYVFAWTEMNYADQAEHIHMQRLSNDGKTLWDDKALAMTDEVTSYPYLVNSGDNTCIMVYARTASKILYARKLDFEGENVWGKDVRIYRGGWGKTPIQTQISVCKSGDGGVLVAWTDDRTGSRIETPYLSYVTADGKLGFSGVSDEADAKLTYNEWRSFNLVAVPAADGSGFFTMWRRTDNDQRFQGISVQKVDKKGELLWGDDALDLVEPKEHISLGFTSIQAAGESDACGFFMEYRSYFDQSGYAVRFDSEGKPVWSENNGVIELTQPERNAASLASQPIPGQDAYIINWTDSGTSGDDKATSYYMARFDENGKFGLPSSAVEMSTPENGLSFANGELRADLADGTAVDVYDITGAKVTSATIRNGKAAADLNAGLYIATAGTGNTVKFIVK